MPQENLSLIVKDQRVDTNTKNGRTVLCIQGPGHAHSSAIIIDLQKFLCSVLFYHVDATFHEPYNLLYKVERHYKIARGRTLIYQLSASLIKRLAPPAIARTEREKYLAKLAAARKITRFDLAIAVVVLLDFVLTYVDSVTRWLYVGIIDLLLSALLLALLMGWSAMRPLLGRLMLAGLVAGICELFTDASGQQLVHSLIYPPGELSLWASPIYMPLTWMITLTYLGYLGWRTRALLGWRFAILLCGLVGAIDIPLFEEMSYHGGWWRYMPARLMLGHTPAYVSLFEGLVVAALPLVFDRIERRPWFEAAVVGVMIGIWMAIAALTAWLLLGL
jgi:uncharacterized protein DUF6989